MRDGSTYRGARRNKCLRELKTVWGPHWYYEGHGQTARHKQRSQKKKAAKLAAQSAVQSAKFVTAHTPKALRIRREGRGQ
ncbi:MAG TPA: hypothetical protein VMT89_07185 [Candidatus Acidoferrales bacterium]|nr:hypothetical protein [Candidatus Acidoferrales bacterium]